MWILISIILLAIIAIFLVMVSKKPNEFSLSRSLSMKASPYKIYPYVSNFHKWALWSPYEKMDEMMNKKYSGPEDGKGAIYEWEGNNKVGKGRMEILEAEAPNKLAIDLQFLKPFEAHNTGEFIFYDEGETTLVTWKMSGKNNFRAKLIHTILSIDKLIGKDFEKGLENLKVEAERER